MSELQIVIPLYPNVTHLDFTGPHQVLSRLPGAKVVVADLNAEKGEALANEVGGVFVSVDVTKTDQNEKAVAAALALWLLFRAVAVAVVGRPAHGVAGVPVATTRPPASPPPGPRSMTQSAVAIASRLCSTRTTVLPASTSRCSSHSSRHICRMYSWSPTCPRS